MFRKSCSRKSEGVGKIYIRMKMTKAEHTEKVGVHTYVVVVANVARTQSSIHSGTGYHGLYGYPLLKVRGLVCGGRLPGHHFNTPTQGIWRVQLHRKVFEGEHPPTEARETLTHSTYQDTYR